MAKADKAQFDAVLSVMISTPPKKTAEIKAPKTTRSTSRTAKARPRKAASRSL